MKRMIAALVLSLTALVFALTHAAEAQQNRDDAVWIQIAARATLQSAQEEAQGYAARLPDVAGFALGGGWYGILVGPYARDDADRVLQVYRGEGQIPRDSFIAFPSSLGNQFYPVGAAQAAVQAPVPAEEPQPELPRAAETPLPETQLPDESPAEARNSEAALTREERMDLQVALKAAGFYNASIDGAFGRGTRGSMADWQAAMGYEPTGILTTAQRKALMDAYNAPLISVGMARIEDRKAGISMRIPAGEVEFSHYEPPFAHYNSTGSLGARVLLISQPGGRSTLYGLYDIMQTLEIVPLEGPRARGRDGFTLEGRNSEIVSYTEARLEDGQIKGFTLIWPAGDEERRTRVLAAMQDSFARLDGVLDPGEGANAQQNIDLISGLEVRKPRLSRSGFYTDSQGTVVTTADAVEGCARITLDFGHQASVAAADAETGLAVLRPSEQLAPMSVAGFANATPRLNTEVAVSGFSYEGVLSAPSLTWGKLADVKGLAGDSRFARLELAPQPGDAGGPVLDDTGAVLGMLLPPLDGSRQLPEGVSFAVSAEAIRATLTQAGLGAGETAGTGAALPSEALVRMATGMTVLVSCWD